METYQITRERHDDESRLVERARAGDRDALEELARLHFGSAYALLHRLVGNHEDAEDLAQECFVRAWSALRKGAAPRSFAAWIRTIALRLARDHHRVRVRRGIAGALEAEVSRVAAKAVADEGSARELGDVVRRALERLPARLRETLFLRVLEGLDYDEVGRAVGVKPATARTRVMQARKLLLRWLGATLDGRSS